MQIEKTKIDKAFEWIFISLFLLLVIGIPLVFTPLTRSVFEVNKLMLLRISTILIIGVWLVKHLIYRHNNIKTKDTTSFLGFQWQKIGLEIPILIWLGSNILSTVFSQNIRIALHGSYDRWEGLVTYVNYIILFIIFAKLVKTKKQLMWVLWAIFISTGLSGLYGVFQSLGHDLINWSLDPSLRVFACINNPVHYCAYVGMVVPLGLGLSLYFSKHKDWTFLENKKHLVLQISIFLTTALMYYNQYLSYSRATWLGFIGAMTLFFIIALNLLNHKNQKNYLIDFFITTIGTAAFYLFFLFRLQDFGLKIAIPLYLTIIGCLFILFYLIPNFKKENKENNIKESLLIAVFFFAVYFNILYPSVKAVNFPFYIHFVLSIILIYISFIAKHDLKFIFSKIIIIILFAQIQYTAISFTSFFLTCILCVCFFFLCIYNNEKLIFEKRISLFSYLILFAVILTIPSIPIWLKDSTSYQDPDSAFKILSNVKSKISSYKQDALKGTARTSMWRSSIPWIKDYWLVGSGLDTVKFMYPKYREPEYGILEGGHNFTPDRLHNEYLNTLATKGILGFIAYYLVFILSWLILILNGLFKFNKNPNSYLIISTLSGCIVYLGQVMFNFGVVATLFIFFTLMGLSIAILKQTEILEELDG